MTVSCGRTACAYLSASANTVKELDSGVADPQNYLGDLTDPNAGLSGLPTGILKTDRLLTNAPRNVTAARFPNGEILNSRLSPFLSAPGNRHVARASIHPSLVPFVHAQVGFFDRVEDCQPEGRTRGFQTDCRGVLPIYK